MSGEASVPAGADELLFEFRWVRPEGPGVYVRLVVEQYDANGGLLHHHAAIVGRRPESQAVPTLVHLERRAARVRMILENAYHESPVAVGAVQVSFLAAGGNGGHCPAGAVGLIAADPAQVGDLVREMVEHFDHYRDTAAAFSADWRRAHDPQRTVAELLARANEPAQTFAEA